MPLRNALQHHPSHSEAHPTPAPVEDPQSCC